MRTGIDCQRTRRYGAPEVGRMSDPSASEVTRWLAAWRDGDERALERLLPLVYGELRRLASRYLDRERSKLPF